MQTERLTTDETMLLQEYVLIPHMMTMVGNSIEDIKHSSGFMKSLYLAAAYKLNDLIEQDRKQLKRELDQRSIRVIPDEQRDMVMYHKVICRGYEERFGVIREVMRSRIQVKLAEYMREIERALGSSN